MQRPPASAGKTEEWAGVVDEGAGVREERAGMTERSTARAGSFADGADVSWWIGRLDD